MPKQKKVKHPHINGGPFQQIKRTFRTNSFGKLQGKNSQIAYTTSFRIYYCEN